MGREQGRRLRRQPKPCPENLREGVRKIGRQLLQHLVNQLPLNLRRDAPGLLVDRHDAASMNRLPFLILQNFVLRVRELEATLATHVHAAEEHDTLARLEHVSQEGLVQPR